MTMKSFCRAVFPIFILVATGTNLVVADPPTTHPATTEPLDAYFKMKVPENARRSTGLEWSCECGSNTNLPDARFMDCRISTTVSKIRLNSFCGIGPTQTGLTTGVGGGAGFGWTEQLEDPQYDSLRPGPQTLHYTAVISIYDSKHDPEQPEYRPPIAVKTFEGMINWTLLAEDPKSPLMPTKWDHALQTPVEQALEIHCLRDPVNPTDVEVRVAVDNPPVAMGFNVFRTLDNFIFDIPLTPMAWRPGNHAANVYVADTYCELSERTLTLVFNPSPVAAATLLKQDPFHLSGMNEIWNGKVIKTVTLEMSPTRLSSMPKKQVQAVKSDAMTYLLNSSSVARQLKNDFDLAAARRTVDQALSKNPSDTELMLEMGLLAEATEDWAAAMPYFQMVITWPPCPQKDRAREEMNRLVGMFNEGGDPVSLYLRSIAEENGYVVPTDHADARRLLRDSANGGYAPAMVALATVYQHDLNSRILQPAADAWYRSQIDKWYRKAADLGNEDARKWMAEHR